MKKGLFYIIISFLIIPLIYLLIYAFTYNNEYPKILVNTIRLDSLNYWLSYHYHNTLFYSIGLSLIVSLITIIIIIPASKALALANIKHKMLFRLIYLLPLIIPITSISIGIYYQFLVLGLAGNSIGIIIIHLLATTPYSLIILERAYQEHGNKQELIAYQLKASKLKTFIHITLPQLLSSIMIAFILSFTISFSQYFTTFIIGKGKIETYALKMYPYIIDNNRHYASLFNLIFIVSIVLVIIIVIVIVRVIYKHIFKYRIGKI